MAVKYSLFIIVVLVFSCCTKMPDKNNIENMFEDFEDYVDSDNYSDNSFSDESLQDSEFIPDNYDFDSEQEENTIDEKPDEDAIYEKYQFEWTFIKEETELSSIFSRGAKFNAAIFFNDKYYILSGGDSSYVLQSTDGLNWSILTSDDLPVFSGQGTVTVYGDKIFVLTGSGLYSSSNAKQWDLIDLPEEIGLRDGWTITSWNNSLWIAGGDAKNVTANDLWYSNDGKTWILHTVFENIEVADENYPTWTVESGLKGMSFLKTDEYMLIFGGHDSTAIKRYSYYPYGGGAAFACYQNIFGYSDLSYKINKEKITTVIQTYGENLGITNAVGFRYASKNWIIGGNIIQSDSYFEQRYTGGTTITFCSESDPFSNFYIKKSMDLKNWELDDTFTPQAVEILPVILYHDEKVWIFGAENSSEIWNGTEVLNTYESEKDAICSKGEYTFEENVVIADNKDVLRYKGYTKIKNLYITGYVDDLSPLLCLEEVDNLTVEDTTKLESTESLENMLTINETLKFKDTLLEHIQLPQLQKSGKTAEFINNFHLSSIKFNGLETFPDEIVISGNPDLSVVDINSQKSDISLDSITLYYLPNLEKCYFLWKIKSASNIEISSVPLSPIIFSELEYCDKISMLNVSNSTSPDCKFPKLKKVGEMELNSSNTNGFPLLERIETDLKIIGSNIFGGDDPFPALTSIGGKIKLQNVSEDINGFNSLKTIGGMEFFWIGSKKVTGFGSLEKITGSFSISNIDFIKDLSGFSFLGNISHFSLSSLNIEGNDLLENLDALTVISKLESIKINDNNSLINIAALTNCKSIGADFELYLHGADVLPVSQAELVKEHFLSLGADEEDIFFSDCFENETCE